MTKVNCRDCKQSDCAYFGMDNKTNCKDFEAKAPAAQRQWVGLTDKQMVDAIEPLYLNRSTAEMAAKVSMDEFRAIEAKLKEKNT